MNSALKPVLASAGVPQPSGQASPAKGNVASVNHSSVGLPQGAAALHPANNLAVQNLTAPAPAPAPPPQPHAVPSMAPVTPNMAQMAQNMSHHGNLSQPPAPSLAASPSKGASSSAPLSLVQDKAPSQPLALTRTPEKKEPDSTSQANGTVDSPKSGANTPTMLKAQNPEPNKEKQDIAKTSPSTPKPPEKPNSSPSTPQKPEAANSGSQAEAAQPKVATANEASEKSPAKPSETKPAPAADVAPSQSDSKPVPETANNIQPNEPEKASTPAKQDPPAAETAKTENTKQESAKPDTSAKPEEKKEEAVEKPQSTTEDVKSEEKPKAEPPKEVPKEETVEKSEKVEENVEEPKVENKREAKAKSQLKLATVTPPMRKRRQASPAKGPEGPSPAKKPAEGETTPLTDTRTKRNRTKVQLYQSPTPELAMATKLSASAGRSTPTKPNDDKLIVFYKNEYLAVRNAEGGFYVCQAMQNVYRTTRKIKIRWLSQDKTIDQTGQTYKPDFYDVTDMECVLTTLSLQRSPAGGGAQLLAAAEQRRAHSILQRALGGAAHLAITPEHPDGLDLSLYTDESQLDKKSRKRNSSKSEPRNKDNSNVTAEASPSQKLRSTPKRSPKSTRKAKATPAKNNKKQIAPGSTPVVASTSKTATAVLEKGKVSPKSSPAKRTPAKQSKVEKVETPTPVRKGRRTAAKEVKPIVATPSTSTGKTGRTPRKVTKK